MLWLLLADFFLYYTYFSCQRFHYSTIELFNVELEDIQEFEKVRAGRRGRGEGRGGRAEGEGGGGGKEADKNLEVLGGGGRG